VGGQGERTNALSSFLLFVFILFVRLSRSKIDVVGGFSGFQFRRYFSSIFYSNAFLPFALSVPFAFSGIALGIWARVDGLKGF
jgi:hypothetical protein